MSCYAALLNTPVGPMALAVDEAGGLTHAYFLESITEAEAVRTLRLPDIRFAPERCAQAIEQLGQYFAGQRRSFELELAAEGTPFQQRVWSKLCEIPYGGTVSYGELARQLGLDPRTGSRAVGAANGANPIAIIVPCHRVIGSNGALTGYAGGLHRKQALLELEGAVPARREAQTLFG